MFTRTDRLLLRPVWPEDWTALYRGINDEGVVCNLARAPWPYTEQDARDFAMRAQDPRFPHFLVSLPTERGAELIGSAGLGELDGEAELGYWIAREHWGHGYASEAGRAVVEIARLIGHERLIGSHFVDNPASGRVLRKIGFRPTGVIRPRFSAGRGQDADACEFALDLQGGMDGPVNRPAMAA